MLEIWFNISCCGDAAIAHVHEETAWKVFSRYQREAFAFRRIMPNQKLSLLETACLLIGNVLSDYLHASLEGKILRNLVDILMFRTMQFAGAYRCFTQPCELPAAVRN